MNKATRERLKQDAERIKNPPQPIKKATHRLPDGAEFAIRYCASRKEWVGQLRIPDMGTFCGVTPSAFGLLSKLDDMYLAHKKQVEEKSPQGDVLP